MFFSGEEIEDSSCLAPGIYNAVIETAEHCQNKNCNGYYVKLGFSMIDESGFSVLGFWNVEHENATAEQIGKKQFKKVVVAATGNANLERLEDLIGKKVAVTLGQQDYNGERVNNVTKVESFSSADIPFA
jgi:hypothetical protein